ncbi:MAG: hypothetical protein AB1642_08085 [Pseudomonadota bacterium]
MKTTLPKILPWLAHKAGISPRRAEVLWHAAERHAVHATGETGTPACWQAAMDRLLELVAAESLREDAASFGWRAWARQNEQLWRAPLAVLDVLTLAATRVWRNLRPLQFG